MVNSVFRLLYSDFKTRLIEHTHKKYIYKVLTTMFWIYEAGKLGAT